MAFHINVRILRAHLPARFFTVSFLSRRCKLINPKKTKTETRLNPVKAHMVRDYNPVKIRQSLHFIGLPHSFTVSYRGDAAVSSLKMKRNVVPPVRRSHDPFFFEPQAKWRSGPAREHPAVGVGLKNKNKRGE